MGIPKDTCVINAENSIKEMQRQLEGISIATNAPIVADKHREHLIDCVNEISEFTKTLITRIDSFDLSLQDFQQVA